MTVLHVVRAGPLASLQDAGRFGGLRHGVSASGPMDRGAFERAAGWLGNAGSTGIEFTTAGLCLRVEGGTLALAADGGSFTLRHNGIRLDWPARLTAADGDEIDIAPGPGGNYGYLRLSHEIDVPVVLGSRSTHVVARLGGIGGRGLRAGDVIPLGAAVPRRTGAHPRPAVAEEGRLRILWGLHADTFPARVREHFLAARFSVAPHIDRMGVRLADPEGVFAAEQILSLVSDAIVAGDIQILGDGTPIVLMRDHQPTGGYPRIATLVPADVDRLAQLRPGTELGFRAVTLAEAQGRTGS